MSVSAKIVVFVIVLLLLLFLTFMAPPLSRAGGPGFQTGTHDEETGMAVPFYCEDGVNLVRIGGGRS